MRHRAACYPTNLFPFGDHVDATDGRRSATTDVFLPSVELGVGTLDRVAQRQLRIQRAGADGRAHRVRKAYRYLARDLGGESLADLLGRTWIAIAQQSDELVAAPPRHDVRLAENALERGGDEPDCGIAARMAVGVVDSLE